MRKLRILCINTIIYIKNFVERTVSMPRLAQAQEKENRRYFRDMAVITNNELARAVAKRAGITIADTNKVLQVLGNVIVELVMQGYCVTIYRLGSFFLRQISMPGYSLREKKAIPRKNKWSFTFRKPPELSKKINAAMRELHEEEMEAE